MLATVTENHLSKLTNVLLTNWYIQCNVFRLYMCIKCDIVVLCFPLIRINSLLLFHFPPQLSGVTSHLSTDIDRDANDHCRDSDASYEGDTHWCAHQRAKLPEDLLLSAPGLLPPEGAA